MTLARHHGNQPRQMAIYLIRQLTTESLGAVASRFGGVSAAAICKTAKRVDQQYQKERSFQREANKIRKQLRGGRKITSRFSSPLTRVL